jgi:hypothetical protein
MLLKVRSGDSIGNNLINYYIMILSYIDKNTSKFIIPVEIIDIILI